MQAAYCTNRSFLYDRYLFSVRLATLIVTISEREPRSVLLCELNIHRKADK